MDNNSYNQMQYEGYNTAPYNDPLQAAKKKIIVALIGLVLLLVILVVSGRSTLVINANTAADNVDISYTLTDQKGKAKSGTFSGKSVSKSVGKGTYRVTVRQGDTSYEAIVTAKGFLRKTEVNANLQGEAARSFIGTNPRECMYYVQKTLLSENCNDTYENLQIHRPATALVPPLVENVPVRELYGPLEGIADTKFGTVAVIQNAVSEDEERGHYASIITSSFEDTNRTLLKGLSSDKIYTITSYKDGFLAFAPAFNEFQYFTSLTASPTKVSVKAPTDKSFQPQIAQVTDDAIVVISSNAPVDDIVEGETDGLNRSTRNIDSEVAVVSGGNQKDVAISGLVKDAAYCAADRLCVLTESGLAVYDISGKKPKQVFSVADVLAIQSTPKGFLAITKKEAILLDVTKLEGFAEYTFGEYTYCGSIVTEDGYILCVQKGDSIKSALLINQSSKSNDRIDKKVLELTKSSSISYVSVYDNFIHVVPNYGELEYNEAQNLNLYNPQKKAAANQAISALARKLGLDQPPYQVINSGL